jgi:hypothetical protein
MKRLVVLALVTAMALTGSAFGAYQETFTGGFDLGTNPYTGGWQLVPLQPNFTVGGTYSTSTSGNYLDITTSAYPSTGAAQVVGIVPAQTGNDFYMTSMFNVNQGAYPTEINDSGESIIARADLDAGNAYGIGFSRGWGHFRLVKVAAGVYTNLGTEIDITHKDGQEGVPWDNGPYNVDDSFKVNFMVEGTTVAFTLFDSAGNFIAGRSVTDSDISDDGYSGFMSYLNPNINQYMPGTTTPNPYYVSPTQFPTLMDSTMDDITMTRLSGDCNADGSVTIEDYSALTTRYGSPGGLADGDFNCDGQITIEDYSNLTTHYGDTGGSVPEPATMGLLVLGLGLLRRRS